MPQSRVTGIVLAAGASRRLGGTPKQLLKLGDTTVLGATLEVARSCPFDQLIVTLGGAADAVRKSVVLDGIDIVMADDHASGCSSSLRTALPWVDPRADGIVLMLGDQPGVARTTVTKLIASGRGAPIAVCRYDDGIGHPFWLGRRVFPELAELHGDKGVWRMIESGRYDVRRVPIDDVIPLDVDTWDDYERLLASVPR
ncbi:MAG: nucleotidyltransferase family protein [Actinomycetota bacterium]|nr:nucleotidyltransferase family protein [Actinomycetota bacterium]